MLDETDKQLLILLQNDSKQTNKALSNALGLSITAIYERIKKEARRSISMTRLGEKTALRLVVLAPAVTGKSLLETVEYARELALEYTSSPPGTPAPG